MNQFYQHLLGSEENKSKIPAPDLMIGGLYAVHSNGCWNRIVILALEDSKANVRFIDRGGTASFKEFRLLPLPAHFCDLPPMILAGKLDGFVDEDEEMEDLTNEFERTVEFGSHWGKEFVATTDVADFDDDDFWELNVFDEGISAQGMGCSVNHVLLKWVLERQKSGDKSNAQRKSNDEIRSVPKAIPPTNSMPLESVRSGLFGVPDLYEFLPYEKTLNVTMTRLSRDPADFALQLQSWRGQSLESFQRKMKEVCDKSQQIDPKTVESGKPYACRRGNAEWTRCYVIEIMANGSFYVFLFDSGEFDIIPANEIRTLSEQFANFPAMAMRGVLHNVKPAPPLVSWDEPAGRNACVEFLKLAQGKLLVATQCGPVQKWYSSVIPIWLPLITVKLNCNDVDIGQELCRAGLAVKPEQQK